MRATVPLTSRPWGVGLEGDLEVTCTHRCHRQYEGEGKGRAGARGKIPQRKLLEKPCRRSQGDIWQARPCATASSRRGAEGPGRAGALARSARSASQAAGCRGGSGGCGPGGRGQPFTRSQLWGRRDSFLQNGGEVRVLQNGCVFAFCLLSSAFFSFSPPPFFLFNLFG